MSRIQLALDVADLDEAIAFYTALFDVPVAKRRPGYANLVVADPPLKLVLIEGAGPAGGINHLGVEVADTAAVETEQGRLASLGLVESQERDSTCCYAVQDKFWVGGAPGGTRWEVYTVLADADAMTAPDEECCAESA
ncbi:cadmium-induced metalloenzyme CadI [Alteromonas gracilis]